MQQQPQNMQNMQNMQTMGQAPMEPETTRNLMINYIPTTIDEMQLRQLFEQYGPIESVKIVCDRETRQSRGYGFVKYRQSASAQMAIEALNGYPIMNKRLKVALAANGDRQRQQVNYYAQMGMNPYAAQMHAQQQMMAMQYQQYLLAQQQAAAMQQQRPM